MAGLKFIDAYTVQPKGENVLGMDDFPDRVWLVGDETCGKVLCAYDRSRRFADGTIHGVVVAAEESDAEILKSRLGYDKTIQMDFDEARAVAQVKGVDCLFLVDGVRPSNKDALNILAAHFVA